MRIVNYFNGSSNLTAGLLAGDVVVDAADVIKSAKVKVDADPKALVSLDPADCGKLDAAADLELAPERTGQPSEHLAVVAVPERRVEIDQM